jgi:hypothetical protein
MATDRIDGIDDAEASFAQRLILTISAERIHGLG